MVERCAAALLGCATSAFFANATDYSLFLCGAAGALIVMLLVAKATHSEIRIVAVRKTNR